MSFKKKVFPLAVLLLFVSSALYPEQGKKLTIRGLRIFSEKELYSQLQLNRFEEGKIPLAEVITSIEKFYRKRNYPLIKIYATEVRATNEYALFVDEGRLGRIIVHNLNNYYSLKFKQNINIPGRIYNPEVIARNMELLKRKFPSTEILVALQQPPDYEGNLIQLDRELQRLKLGQIFNTDFFDIYTPVHDLHFFVKNYRGSSFFSGKNDASGYNLGYDINYKYPSLFIPEVEFFGQNLLFQKDFLLTNLSSGFDPGLGGFFNIHPSNTLVFPPVRRFIDLNGEYKVSPMDNELIGPLVRGRLYHSNGSRTDLGLTGYKNLNTRGTVAPEFTLLKNLNIYAGFGAEQVKIYESNIDYSADRYLESSDGIYKSTFAETRLKFDPIPVRMGNVIDKYFIMTYTDYLTGNKSHELEILGAYDTVFDDLSILSLKLKAVIFFDNPPFYHNSAVSDSFFRGFTKKDYYTNRELAISSEYRFSIFRDFIYTGVFFDVVVFEPEGYNIYGTKQGICYGPTGRVLLYDQFEFVVYFGFDRLFPDNETGTNLKMKFSKKW